MGEICPLIINLIFYLCRRSVGCAASLYIKQNLLLKNTQIRSLHSISNIDAWFITGFIDAKGCFILALRASNQYKQKYQVNLLFQISLHTKDLDVLIKIKNYFGAGRKNYGRPAVSGKYSKTWTYNCTI